MRQTNVKWIVLGMAALAAGFLAMRPLASSAQEGEGQPGAATPAMQPASPMTAMPMHCMKALAEVKKLLNEARTAADAGDAKAASGQIANAEQAIDRQHAQMHGQMAERMAQMQKKRMERMQGMKQMTEEMQEMQQTMEKQEGMKEMAGKMEAMRKKFQKMHEGMMQEGMHGETGAGMKCPMCGKMMGEMDQPHKVVNSRCPIMGTKLDVDHVPANLTREFKGQKIGFCCPGCPPAWDKLSDADKEAKLKQVMGEAAEQVKTQQMPREQ